MWWYVFNFNFKGFVPPVRVVDCKFQYLCILFQDSVKDLNIDVPEKTEPAEEPAKEPAKEPTKEPTKEPLTKTPSHSDEVGRTMHEKYFCDLKKLLFIVL